MSPEEVLRYTAARRRHLIVKRRWQLQEQLERLTALQAQMDKEALEDARSSNSCLIIMLCMTVAPILFFLLSMIWTTL